MNRIRGSLRGGLAALLILTTLGAPQAGHAASELTYVTMSDGVQIAVAVNYPEGFEPSDEAAWPTLFMMDGYAGGASPTSVSAYGNNYVTVHASIRGTGCSGGRFDLFDRRHALDGYEIIEGWIVNQSWSNGKVGIIGHSYPGLTGFLVASTDPPHLTAIAISGLIDDLYRGIVFPGGVGNYGFPAVWTGAYRPASELSGNASRYGSETTSGDPTCAANIATRPPREVLDDPILQGAVSTQDETWWAVRSLYSYIRGITKPIHITQQYQDEQTGPRGGHVLWQRINNVPKRLVVTNGVHGTTGLASADRVAWLDCWILADGQDCGAVTDPSQRVQLYFETQNNTTRPAEYVTSDWPAPETDWQRYLLRADGTLSTDATGADGDVSYVSTSAGRQMTADAGMGFGDDGLGQLTFFDGPDQARYELAFDEPTAVAGPATMTLWATSTAPDTDFFVDVLDVETATGATTYLQRGMLRASHRALDGLRSDRVASGPHAGEIYRPHHPHTSPTTIIPAQPYEYTVEIFPVGHVFRTGHKLVLQIHTPPPADPLSIYAWVPVQPPAVNTIHQSAAMRTSILLPLLPVLPAVGEAAPSCGSLVGNPCFVPVA